MRLFPFPTRLVARLSLLLYYCSSSVAIPPSVSVDTYPLCRVKLKLMSMRSGYGCLYTGISTYRVLETERKLRAKTIPCRIFETRIGKYS